MPATNLNRVVLTGNLTHDPELRSTNSGTSVCSLRVACNTRRKNTATGEWQDKANYFQTSPSGERRARTAPATSPRAAPSRSTGASSGASGRPPTATSARPSRSSPTPSSSSAAATAPPPRPRTNGNAVDDEDATPVGAGGEEDDIPF